MNLILDCNVELKVSTDDILNEQEQIIVKVMNEQLKKAAQIYGGKIAKEVEVKLLKAIKEAAKRKQSGVHT
jgi:hypothetical protein